MKISAILSRSGQLLAMFAMLVVLSVLLPVASAASLRRRTDVSFGEANEANENLVGSQGRGNSNQTSGCNRFWATVRKNKRGNHADAETNGFSESEVNELQQAYNTGDEATVYSFLDHVFATFFCRNRRMPTDDEIPSYADDEWEVGPSFWAEYNRIWLQALAELLGGGTATP